MEIQYDNELWKEIKNYETFYQISNYGRVKSLNRLVKNKNGYKNTGERILKPTQPKDNVHYSSVVLCKDGKTKSFLIKNILIMK